MIRIRRSALLSILLATSAGLLAACGGDESGVQASEQPDPRTAPLEASADPRPGPDLQPPPAAPRRPDPFAGTFQARDEGIVYTLELGTRDGQRYAGTLSFNGERAPIQGSLQNGRLVGRFDDPDGSRYGFAGQPSREGIVFALEDDDPVAFQRVAGAPARTPVAAPPPSRAPAAGTPSSGWPPPPAPGSPR